MGGCLGGAVTAIALAQTNDVEGRLKVWRERWRHAPSADARAHAQVAIDLWLDRLIDIDPFSEPDDIPVQTVAGDLVEAISA